MTTEPKGLTDEAAESAILLRGLAKNDLVKNAPLAVFVLTKAAACIVALQERCAELERERDNVLSKESSTRAMRDVAITHLAEQEARAERAEAEVAKLRRVVEAAKALRRNYWQSSVIDFDAAIKELDAP